MRSKQSRAAGALDLAVVAGDGEHPPVGGGDDGGAPEEARHRVAELGEGTTGEHDAHEHPVHLVLAVEERRLLVDDLLQRPHPRGRVGGQGGEVDRGPRVGLAVRWQGLCVTGSIVGNNDHPATVDPSIASAPWHRTGPRRAACPRPSRRCPPPSSGRPPGRRGSWACTRSRSTSTWPDACCPCSPRMPCRCRPRCASPSRRERCRWGVVAGDEVLVGAGRVTLPALDVVAVRTWRPARVRPAAAPRARPLTPRSMTCWVRARRPTAAGSPTASDSLPPASGAQVVAGAATWAPDSGTRSPGWSVAGPGSRRRVTTRSPAPCSSPSRSAPARRSPMPCAPASVPRPRCPPPCSTPPPTATPRATWSPSSTPPSANDARCRGPRPPGRARHRPHLGRRPRGSGSGCALAGAGGPHRGTGRKECRMTTHVELRRGAYHDSVSLMQVSRAVAGTTGRHRGPGRDGHRAQRRRAARHGVRRARRGRAQRPRRGAACRRRRRAGCRAGRGRRRPRGAARYG